MNKKFYLISGVLSALILTLLIAVVLAYFAAARHGMPELSAAAYEPGTEVTLGDTVYATADCAVPWGQSVNQVTLQPDAAGVVVRGSAEWRLLRFGWRKNVMRIRIPLRPYRIGKLAPGVAAVVIERPGFVGGPRKLTLDMPLGELAVTAREVGADAELPVAGVLTAHAWTESRVWLWGLVGLAALLALSVWWFYRRRRRSELRLIVVPPWEQAKNELAELRRAADGGEKPLPWCVARLTDVVRDYLSARFKMPVKQQTTGEFLYALRHGKSPLSTAQVRSLGDFMSAADLVKFARMTPDAGYFNDAVTRAESLVDETRPAADGAVSGNVEKDSSKAEVRS